MANADPDSIPKNYVSKTVEAKWYELWTKKGYFHADPNTRKKVYSMVIPPPNITGILHMGHALNNTLQDIKARYKRMRGYEVLWMPGTDHAGIATQHVVEKMLKKQNLDRQTLGREKFLAKVWEWREKYGNSIVNQQKRIGCSCDWDRLRFTMDEGLSRAVREGFVRLYDQGLIYKGHYIINWCPRCRTALSDEEVTHKEILGHFYSIKYAVEGTEEHLVIATTRPETMLGDTAVGFNPSDKRYAHLKGKTVILPLLNRKLKVIADEVIDPAFGTGALKITPAHDPVDFELGKKHGLDFINILNPDGTLNDNAGPYKGLDRFAARSQIIRELEERRLLIETKEHRHSVGHCYRCDTVIEPYTSDQWFVRMKKLAKPAIAAVRDKKIQFVPERWTKVYLDWMVNIKDWCISRQIWWGHRLPVWTCAACAADPKDKNKGIIVARETPKACPRCKSAELVQEEDVLDTWFSSWLWPFSTMGWPDKTPELKKFYPTTTLVTGYEIIFFWVARMIMAGYEFMGKEPFRDIYIHGIVRDSTGAKMSKSLGNIVDPIDIIDEFGADALRFSIITITSEGQDVYASKERFEIGRNFANKIWNASRFALINLKPNVPDAPPPLKDFGPADRWIMSRLHRLVRHTTVSLDRYRFNDASSALYEFFWHEFCDWYLELIKGRMDSPACQWVLKTVLRTSMKLLLPFMPFITEEIWELLTGPDRSLMKEPWPEFENRWLDAKAEQEISILTLQVQAVRNIRSTWQINPKDSVTVLVKTAGSRETELFKKYSDDLMHLAKVGSLKYGPTIKRPKQSVIASVGRIETYVVLSGVVDVDMETNRIESALVEVDKLMKGLETKLQNEDFTRKAPKEIVQKEKSRYKELVDRKKRLQENLKILTS